MHHMIKRSQSLYECLALKSCTLMALHRVPYNAMVDVHR